jgi:hypothetical protein
MAKDPKKSKCRKGEIAAEPREVTKHLIKQNINPKYLAGRRWTRGRERDREKHLYPGSLA